MFSQKKSTDLGPGGSQEFREYPEPVFPQMSQLPAVDFLDRTVETRQTLEPAWRDTRHYDSPVLGFTRTQNQAPVFETIEEPGNIGIAGDHAVGDLARGQPFGCSA